MCIQFICPLRAAHMSFGERQRQHRRLMATDDDARVPTVHWPLPPQRNSSPASEVTVRHLPDPCSPVLLAIIPPLLAAIRLCTTTTKSARNRQILVEMCSYEQEFHYVFSAYAMNILAVIPVAIRSYSALHWFAGRKDAGSAVSSVL